MGRFKTSIITMAMMLMVATALLGMLHVWRLSLGEAREPEAVVWANVAACGVGVLAEAVLIMSANQRIKGVVTTWAVLAPMRAAAHVAVATIMLMSGPDYPTIVLTVYLFVLAGFLVGCARRAQLFVAFLRSGRPEPDDNPERSARRGGGVGVGAKLAVSQRWMGSERPPAGQQRGSVSTGGYSLSSSNRPASSLLRWGSNYEGDTADRTPRPSTPPRPDRTYGFDPSTGEETTSYEESDTDGSLPAGNAVRTAAKGKTAAGALIRSTMGLPPVHRMPPTYRRRQSPQQQSSPPRKSSKSPSTSQSPPRRLPSKPASTAAKPSRNPASRGPPPPPAPPPLQAPSKGPVVEAESAARTRRRRGPIAAAVPGIARIRHAGGGGGGGGGRGGGRGGVGGFNAFATQNASTRPQQNRRTGAVAGAITALSADAGYGDTVKDIL